MTRNKKFAPFFWTQFWGAFNDNFFKNALVLLITYKGIKVFGMDESMLVALSGGVFILPFFLFSPIAGQICDKYERSMVMRRVKLLEMAIMAIAAIGFLFDVYGLLLFVLFLMGFQSTLFGPIKYSIIPDLIPEEELTEATAFVQLGTFISILLGTIIGGATSGLEGVENYIGLCLVAVAGLGYFHSRGVPDLKPASPELEITYNPIPNFKSLWKISREKIAVWNSIVGASWFWFFGAGILSVLPVYCKDYLGVSSNVATGFLAMFTLGIGTGSMLAEKFSGRKVEIGIVPLGSLGMTIFLIDLFLVNIPWQVNPEALMSFGEFWSYTEGKRLLVDFFLMSVFGGIYIVPLYTLLQERSDSKVRSRVIASNNIMNAIFMVVSSLMVMACYHFELTTAEIFFVLAVMNVVVSVYIYSVVPEFTLRFYSWILSNILYRVNVKGVENIPHDGPVMLASNHVSFIDWLIISGACSRPARFVMHEDYFNVPIIKSVLKQAKVIPIAGGKENPGRLKEALKQISAELKEREIVIIFPEGTLTRDGKLNPFRPGIQKMVEQDPVPVVPVTLKNLWGSFFCRGKRSKFPWKLRATIEVEFYPVTPPNKFDYKRLEAFIAEQLGEEAPSVRLKR